MKRQILWVTFVGAITSSLFAQGTILFSTVVSGKVNAPTFWGSCNWGLLFPETTAQLFLVSGGSHSNGSSAVYTPLYPTTTFHNGSRHVVVPDEPVVVPGLAPGQTATIIMRAWQGSSYERSTIRGETPLGGAAQVTLGGRLPNGTELPPAPLTGLQGWSIAAPCIHIRSVTAENENLRFTLVTDWPFHVILSSVDLETWRSVATNSGSTGTIPLSRSEHPTFFRAVGRIGP